MSPNGKARKKRRKRSRPRHSPQRTCITCKIRFDKKDLVRIVRTTEGTVAIDPTGKLNGRGAYLCKTPSCWSDSLSKQELSRALKTEIDEETMAKLEEFAESLS